MFDSYWSMGVDLSWISTIGRRVYRRGMVQCHYLIRHRQYYYVRRYVLNGRPAMGWLGGGIKRIESTHPPIGLTKIAIVLKQCTTVNLILDSNCIHQPAPFKSMNNRVHCRVWAQVVPHWLLKAFACDDEIMIAISTVTAIDSVFSSYSSSYW